MICPIDKKQEIWLVVIVTSVMSFYGMLLDVCVSSKWADLNSLSSKFFSNSNPQLTHKSTVKLEINFWYNIPHIRNSANSSNSE